MRQDVLRAWAKSEVERKKEEHRAKHKITDLEARRARIHADLLTKHPVWDVYLEQIEELQERDRRELRPLEERLLSLEYLPDAEASELRQRTSILKARIHARDECLRIPRSALEAEAPPTAP